MTDKKKIFQRGLEINNYLKLRYNIHSNYIINCQYCKLEYKLSMITIHLKTNKRCINIQKELELIDKDKYNNDNITFYNNILNMKKNIFEDYFTSKDLKKI
jgi:hypothetical protein